MRKNFNVKKFLEEALTDGINLRDTRELEARKLLRQLFGEEESRRYLSAGCIHVDFKLSRATYTAAVYRNHVQTWRKHGDRRFALLPYQTLVRHCVGPAHWPRMPPADDVVTMALRIKVDPAEFFLIANPGLHPGLR